MSCSQVWAFTCDHPSCGRRTVPGHTSLNSAIAALREAGWSAGKHTGVYCCPEHRRTRTGFSAPAANRAYSAIRAARLEDYAELRSWGLRREQAAARLGVSVRTAERYDAELRQQRQEAA